MSYKIKFIFTMTLILFISFFSCKDGNSNKASVKNEEITVKWEKISGGLKNAELQKKPVLIFFYTEWCIYCKKMIAENFGDQEIVQYMNENFISFKVNPEKDNENFEIMGEKIPPSKLMAYTGSNGFPTMLFLNSKVKPVTTIPGFVEKHTFLAILKYMKEECYENKVSIDNYIKNPDLCRGKKNSSLVK